MKSLSALGRLLTLAISLVGLTGCHTRYKKMAGKIGSVKPVVAAPGAPILDVDGVSGGNASETAVEEVVDAVVGVGLAVKATKVQAHLQRAVDPEEVGSALTASILEAPGKGALPHSLGPQGRHEMAVSLVQYGVGVDAFGPSIDTTIRVRIDRKRDGKRIYRATTSCSEPLADSRALVLPGVEQVQTLQSLAVVEAMNREELRAATIRGVERCGQEVVERMVRHAR